jgi:hypothetical protein
MDRDEFFTQLDQLTPKEIEERLPSWDMEQLVLAQEYLALKELEQTRAAEAVQTRAAEAVQTNIAKEGDALLVSVQVARRSHTLAMLALIFSVGAMLAAVAAAIIAFLALRGGTISW